MKKEGSYIIPIYRLELVKESEAEVQPVTSPQELASQLKDLAVSDREQMVCTHLDAKNRPIGRQTVSIGALDYAIATPREVFKAALLSNARSIVLAHNHPSGDVTPSEEDDRLTQMLARAGRLMGIALLDHVILGPGGDVFSYHSIKPGLLEGGDA